MKLTDIKEFVNAIGAWQSKDCYDTKVEKIKYTVVVYNECKWLENERCTDSVTIDLGSNGMGKIVSIDCEFGVDLCAPYVREFYEKCLKENTLDKYVIDREGVWNTEESIK